MRLSRTFKWTARALVALALALLAAAVGWIASGGPARLLSRQLSAALGTPLTVEQIQLPGLRHAAVENLALLLPDGRPFLFMERVELHFSYSGLLLGNLGQAQVSGWELFLFLDEHGRPAVPPLTTGGGEGGALPKLEIALLRGKLEIDNATRSTLASYDVPGIDIEMGPKGVSVHAGPPLAPRLFTELTVHAGADGSALLTTTALRPDLALAEAARMGYTLPFPLACDGPVNASVEMPAVGAPTLAIAGPAAQVRIDLASTPLSLRGPRLTVTQSASMEFAGRLEYDALTAGAWRLTQWPHGVSWSARLPAASEAHTTVEVRSDGGELALNATISAEGDKYAAEAALHLRGPAVVGPQGLLTAHELEASIVLRQAGAALAASMDARGEVEWASGEAKCQLRGLAVSLECGADVGRKTATLQADLKLADVSLAASDVTSTAREALASMAAAWRDGMLTARGKLSGRNLVSRVASLQAQAGLAHASADFTASYAAGEAAWSLSGRGENLAAEQKTSLADAGTIGLTARGKGRWDPLAGTAHAAVQIDAATAMALDGRLIAQNLCLGVALDAASSEARLAGVGTLSATAGDVLYDTLFASLAEFPLRVESAYESSPGSARPALVHVELPGLIAEASGQWEPDAWKPRGVVGVDARVQLARLLPLVQPALAPLLPAIAEATAAGAVHVEARLRPDPPAAAGTLELADVDALLPKLLGLLSTGVHARLPFSLAPGATDELPVAPPGTLSIDSLALPGVVLNKIALQLSLSQNRLALVEPWRIRQYGGQLALTRLEWDDVLSATSAFAAEGNLESLDLGQATAAAGKSLFEGTLDCPDFAIHRDGRRYFLSRPLRLVAFGGEVILSDLSAEDPGSPYMDLRTSVEIKRIDLGRLTSVIPVGRITGILEGYARDVVIVGGEEMAFDVDLHTVPTRGVPQDISAKAIKNLLIGTEIKVAASFSNTLSQYSYSKLGLKARLAKGILRLEGTQKAEDGQFFMVGAGMNKLNIVLHGVDRGIDYKEFRRTLLAQIRGVDLNKMPDVEVK